MGIILNLNYCASQIFFQRWTILCFAGVPAGIQAGKRKCGASYFVKNCGVWRDSWDTITCWKKKHNNTGLSAAASTELRISTKIVGSDPVLSNFCCNVCAEGKRKWFHTFYHLLFSFNFCVMSIYFAILTPRYDMEDFIPHPPSPLRVNLTVLLVPGQLSAALPGSRHKHNSL